MAVVILWRDLARARDANFRKLASLSLLRDDVLVWFGGRAAFVALHQVDPDERPIAECVIE